MDWQGIIERHRQALHGVVAMLVALGGFAEAGRVLARHRRNAVLRLLRPAEAAARRLIVAAARGLVVTLAPLRPQRGDAGAQRVLLDRLGIAHALAPAAIARLAALARATARRPARQLLLSLVDPLPRGRPARPRCVAPHAAPRVLFSDSVRPPHRLPPPPTADDLLDATRLGMRLAALAGALDDLPRQALRLARWRARRARLLASGRPGRLSSLRPGRAPGLAARRRRRDHEVHAILEECQWIAYEATTRADTS